VCRIPRTRSGPIPYTSVTTGQQQQQQYVYCFTVCVRCRGSHVVLRRFREFDELRRVLIQVTCDLLRRYVSFALLFMVSTTSGPREVRRPPRNRSTVWQNGSFVVSCSLFRCASTAFSGFDFSRVSQCSKWHSQTEHSSLSCS
jgi:hypothetical protein